MVKKFINKNINKIEVFIKVSSIFVPATVILGLLLITILNNHSNSFEDWLFHLFLFIIILPLIIIGFIAKKISIKEYLIKNPKKAFLSLLISIISYIYLLLGSFGLHQIITCTGGLHCLDWSILVLVSGYFVEIGLFLIQTILFYIFYKNSNY